MTRSKGNSTVAAGRRRRTNETETTYDVHVHPVELVDADAPLLSAVAHRQLAKRRVVLAARLRRRLVVDQLNFGML